MTEPIRIDLRSHRHGLEPSTIIWSAVRSIGLATVFGLLGIAAGLALLIFAILQPDSDSMVLRGIYGFALPIVAGMVVFVSVVLSSRSIRDRLWIASKFLHQPYDLLLVKLAILNQSPLEFITLKDVAELTGRAELTKTISVLTTASGKQVHDVLILNASELDAELPLNRTRYTLRFSPSTEILTVVTTEEKVPSVAG